MAGKLANLLVTAADNLGIWHLHVVMVLTVCCTVNTHAQQISVNSNGDRVIVFDDGSWRYYEAADSVLLNMEELPLETLMEPNQIKVTNTNVATKTFNYQTYLDYMRGARRYEADLGDQVDQAQEKLYEVEDAIRYAETKDNLQLLEQKSHELELAQGELRAKQKALVQLRSDIAKIRRIGSKAKFDRLRNIQLPDRYLAGIETSEEGLAVQPALMPDAEQTMKKHVSQKEPPAEKEVEPVDNEGTFSAAEAGTGQGMMSPTGDSREKTRRAKPSQSATSKIDVQSAVPSFFAFSHSSDQDENSYECQFAFVGSDEFTKQQKRELKEELLFTHTDPQLKPYFKEREHVTCAAYMTSISGGFRYLNLIFRIASRSAKTEYGHIAKGTLVNLKLMNGKTVSLYCQKGDAGIVESSAGDTVYRALFPIDFQKEKLLLRSELDKMRVVWSTGYEDYDVHNVDLLINQLNCLGSK